MHTFSRAVLRVPLERDRRTQDLRNAPGLSDTPPRRERLIGIEDFADRSDARIVEMAEKAGDRPTGAGEIGRIDFQPGENIVS